jgi:hypothetical protein
MTAASDAASRARLAALNQGPGDIAERAAAQRVLTQYGPTPGYSAQPGNMPVSQAEINQSRLNNIAGITAAAAPRPVSTPHLPSFTSTASSSSGGGGSRRRSGGGGGGAAPAPTMTQAMLDWLSGVLRGGAPTAQTAGTLDLPDYTGMAMRDFDPTMFNQARTALNQGVQTDLGTAQQATQNMLGFLNSNYSNAFNNPNNTYATAGQAPGMNQQAMGRLMSSYGVNPNATAPTQNQGVQADQAFGNLWRTLAGNEDIAQRGRIGNAQQYGTQAQQAIQAAGRAGGLGLDLGQTQAQAAWQKAADDRAYQDYQMQQQLAQQEALQNWQRSNQVQDANTTATNTYRNSELSSLLGLLPQLIQSRTLNLPSLASLGLGG